MQDFNEFISNENARPSDGNKQQNLMALITKIAKNFDGKSQNELIKAIFEEAKKNKQNGTLSNAEIDGFYNMLYPLLDNQKRSILAKIVEDLKKL